MPSSALSNIQQTLKKFFVFSPLIIICFGAAGCFDQEKSAEDKSSIYLKQAKAYANQGQFKAAIIEARNVLQLDPESAEGQLILIDIFNTLGQHDAAIQQLQNSKHQNTADFLFELVRAYNGRGKFNSALATLNENEKLLKSADQLKYLIYLGDTLKGNRKFEEAIKAYTNARKQLPTDIDVLSGLAESYINLNQSHEAFEVLEEMQSVHPQDTKTLLFKAQLAYRDGNLDEAEALLTDALSYSPSTDIMTPERASILTNLSNVLTRQGRSSEALIYTRLIAEAFPGAQLNQTKFESAVEHFRAGEYAEAQTLLEEILKDAPGYDGAHQLLGIIKYAQGDLKAADEYFSGNIDPEIAGAASLQAYALTNLKLNRPREVLNILEDSIARENNAALLAIYGLAAVQTGKVEAGLNSLEKALSVDPDNLRIYQTLAYIENTRSNFDDALAYLKRAHEIAPDDSAVQRNLAHQYVSMGDADKASEFVAALLAKKQSEQTLLLAGDFAKTQGNIDTAIQHYQKANAASPASAHPLVSLGAAHASNLDWPRSQEAFRQALQKDPLNSRAIAGLLISSDATNNLTGAIDHILKLAESTKEPGHPSALIAQYFARKNEVESARRYLELAQTKQSNNEQSDKTAAFIAYKAGSMELAKGNYEGARNAALEGLRYAPDASIIQILLAEAEIKSGNLSEAEKVIEQFKDNNQSTAMLLQADILLKKGEEQKALKSYSDAWQLQPSNPLAIRTFGLQKRLGKEQEARAFLEMWLTALPESPEALTFKGTENLMSGNTKEAILDLEKAIAARPESPMIINNLAWAYQSIGNPKAESLAKRAVQLAPENAAILDTYGWILYKAGKKDEALDILDKALKLAPTNAEIQQHHAEVKAAL